MSFYFKQMNYDQFTQTIGLFRNWTKIKQKYFWRPVSYYESNKCNYHSHREKCCIEQRICDSLDNFTEF